LAARPRPATCGDQVIWPDGTPEKVDTVVFATGYRPHLDYLSPLGALDGHSLPQHTGGISATHPGLVYVGLEFQRSFSSNTPRIWSNATARSWRSMA
jgi:putative flavoprotein involved in K+ transport